MMVSYFFVEKQSVYSSAPADWANVIIGEVEDLNEKWGFKTELT